MSPATSAVISGKPQIDMKNSTTNGDREARVADVAAERRRRSGRRVWSRSTTTKMIGTSIAAPSPRYVRFWASELRSSQR